MRVRTRLLASLLIITIVLVAPAMYSLERLTGLRDIAFDLRGRHASAWVAAGELRTALVEADRYQRAYVITFDPASRDSLQGALDRARRGFERLSDAGYGEVSASARQVFEELEAASAEVDRLIGGGRAAEATAFLQKVRPLLRRMDDALGDVVEAVNLRSSAAVQAAQSIAAAAAATVLFALLASVALAFFVGLGTTERLIRPLHQLRRAMARVAEGNPVTESFPDTKRRDELGDLARSFQSMTSQLSELGRLKAEFVSKTSHNLKTPLNVIAGYSEMLGDGLYGELNKDQIVALTAIREQVAILDTQLRQLVDLSRLEAGAFTLHMEPLYVEDLLAALRRSFGALAEQKQIEFLVESEETAPATLVGDEDRLRNEVLGNLLANAFKFTPTGGRIEVRAHGGNGRLEIDVKDTGVGIDRADLPRIFDRYYQTREGARAAGSGLGLAMAKEIVTRHGGEISADSTRGGGTTFRVSLPVGGDGG